MIDIVIYFFYETLILANQRKSLPYDVRSKSCSYSTAKRLFEKRRAIPSRSIQLYG